MKPTAILLATDLSSRCDRALDRATALTAEWQARLVVVHVLRDPFPPPDPPSWSLPPDVKRAAQERVRRDLRNAESIELEVVVAKGDPATAILEVAERLDCGLVVMGVARNEALGRILLGSSVEAVVRKSKVPVLVVKSRPQGPYQNVVVAADFSEGARGALRTVLDLLAPANTSVFHAYHVPFEGLLTETADTLRAAAARAAEDGREFLSATPAAAGRNIPVICQHGEIGALLEPWVVARGADLVAVGTQGRGRLAGILLGSVAQRLLATLSVDVLVVPPA